MVTCPLCDAVLDVEEDELDEGDELTCEECGETIVVKSTDPLELQGADEADEDEDEEDFDDFDEDEEEEEEEEEDEDW
jgi:DNA-directed RNA polymerase subunit M/transcription elongation factor TFIIS